LRPSAVSSGLAGWNLDLLVASPPQQAQDIFPNTFQAQQVLSAPRQADNTSGALNLLLSMTYQRQQQEQSLLQARRNHLALALEGYRLATNAGHQSF
jgi:hypothetical protein